MQTFSVFTRGPAFELEAESIQDVKHYVEDHVPMKRGWSASWRIVSPRKRWVYEVENSNGRHVNEVRVARGTMASNTTPVTPSLVRRRA